MFLYVTCQAMVFPSKGRIDASTSTISRWSFLYKFSTNVWLCTFLSFWGWSCRKRRIVVFYSVYLHSWASLFITGHWSLSWALLQASISFASRAGQEKGSLFPLVDVYFKPFCTEFPRSFCEFCLISVKDFSHISCKNSTSLKWNKIMPSVAEPESTVSHAMSQT